MPRFSIVGMSQELIAAGSPEFKAKAVAASIPASESMATKEDISALRGDLTTAVANLRADMHRTAWMVGIGIVAAVTAIDRSSD